MPRVSGSAWPWLLADDSDAIVGIRSGNVDQLFVFLNDDALNIDMSNLAATWNASGTTFTAIKMNVTDTASAAGSLLLDLQVGGTSQFHVTKSGVIHGKRANFNIASANAPIVSVSNYSLTGSNADSLFDLAGTWNTSGTPTALKLNVTDTASAAGSLLLDLQVGGTSQFRVSKGGRVTALGRATIDTLTIGLGGQTAVATNTALGFEALNSASLTGANNVGIGYQTLYSNTTGSNNSAMGRSALLSNTTGNNNSATGAYALFSNTTGGDNSAVGMYALQNNTTGSNNSALGYAALYSNTTGGDNSATGAYALFSNTTGSNNSAMGQSALQNNTTGSANSAVGRSALFNNTEGSNNTGLGEEAGDVITTGARNTIVGANSDPSANNGNDQTVIGEGLTGKGDDTFFCGGTNGAYNKKNVTTWETTSDARLKKNIVSNGVGLEVISQIDVRNFEYRTPEEITELPQSAAINQPGVQLGVIAQELQAVLPECVTENSTGVLSVNTDPLVWYLVNAVKQLAAEVKTLKGL